MVRFSIEESPLLENALQPRMNHPPPPPSHTHTVALPQPLALTLVLDFCQNDTVVVLDALHVGVDLVDSMANVFNLVWMGESWFLQLATSLAFFP